MNKNYEFFMKTKLEQYLGEWIAICNQRIVSHGKNVKKVYKEAKEKCPSARPLIAKVPDKETMIF